MQVLLGDATRTAQTPQAHRADVLERLLALGVPLRTLEALLPGWADAQTLAAGGARGSTA